MREMPTSQELTKIISKYNAVMPVRLEPAVPRPRVKHFTTEPLRSPKIHVKQFLYNTMTDKDDQIAQMHMLAESKFHGYNDIY